LDSTRVVAVADINPEAVKVFGEEFSIKTQYTNYHEMLAREKLDILTITTWAQTHAEITIAAAEQGVKGILCEKPMCVSPGEADAMIDACSRNDVKLAIGHQGRFYPSNIAARKLIAGGVIGKPALIHRYVTGGLLNNGTHAIDGMRYILSDPETEWVMGQVERKTDRYERGFPVEDCLMGLIYFKNGVRGIIENDTPISDEEKKMRVEAESFDFIYGTDGMLHTTRGGGRESLYLLNNETTGWREVGLQPSEANQYSELIDWIEGRGGHRNDARQARYTIEIMMAIYESVRTKGLVRMPLVAKENTLRLLIDEGALPVEKPGKYDIRLPKELWPTQ